MDKLISHQPIGAVLLISLVQGVTVQVPTASHPALSSVLADFSDIFAELKQLPPQRDCDHSIPLIPGSKPVNIRPYQLPHHKKNALEELIKQLLESQVI